MRRQERSRCKVISSQNPDYSAQSASVIRAGGLVAIPTETLYGLAVDPFDSDALERLFVLKKRSRSKPVLVLVDSIHNLELVAREIPELYQPLIKRFWPGPLTLIFPARYDLPTLLTGDDNTIGIRLSSNVVATEICHRAGGAITATSANISNQLPALNAEDIERILGPGLDLIVDDGGREPNLGSTIVKERGGKLALIRDGLISFKDLLTCL